VLVECVDTEAGKEEANKEQGRSYANLDYGVEYDKEQDSAEDDYAQNLEGSFSDNETE